MVLGLTCTAATNDEDGVCGCFYVKFIVEGDVDTVMLMSCKEWGYTW